MTGVFLLTEQQRRNLLSGSCTHGWRTERGGAAAGISAHNFTTVPEKRAQPCVSSGRAVRRRAALWRRAGKRNDQVQKMTSSVLWRAERDDLLPGRKEKAEIKKENNNKMRAPLASGHLLSQRKVRERAAPAEIESVMTRCATRVHIYRTARHSVHV